MGTSPDFARHWFTARGWKPFVFQKQVWAAIKNGQSGLLHASTGAGKTYAVWFGALERFPWAGHIGLKMLPAVVAELESSPGSLVFTNTRAQSEIWFLALLEARPDWAGLIALHHSSLSRDTRDWPDGIAWALAPSSAMRASS